MRLLVCGACLMCLLLAIGGCSTSGPFIAFEGGDTFRLYSQEVHPVPLDVDADFIILAAGDSRELRGRHPVPWWYVRFESTGPGSRLAFIKPAGQQDDQEMTYYLFEANDLRWRVADETVRGTGNGTFQEVVLRNGQRTPIGEDFGLTNVSFVLPATELGDMPVLNASIRHLLAGRPKSH